MRQLIVLLYVWQVLHPMEIKYVLLKGHGTNHGFSFTPIFPLLSTIPNLPHSFSVHLMNCYFPDFWYSHVTEKRTSEGRNAI